MCVLSSVFAMHLLSTTHSKVSFLTQEDFTTTVTHTVGSRKKLIFLHYCCCCITQSKQRFTTATTGRSTSRIMSWCQHNASIPRDCRPFLSQTEALLLGHQPLPRILRYPFSYIKKKSWSCTKVQLAITMLFLTGTFPKTWAIQSCSGHLLFMPAKKPFPLLLKRSPELILGKRLLHNHTTINQDVSMSPGQAIGM